MDNLSFYMEHYNAALYYQYMMQLCNNQQLPQQLVLVGYPFPNAPLMPTLMENNLPNIVENNPLAQGTSDSAPKVEIEPEEDEIIDVVGLEEETPVTPKKMMETKEITEKVKMELQKYGISQASFGKFMFETRKGTISLLLNYPRPWTSLTESGKKTYIKMREWLLSSIEEKQKLAEESALEADQKRKERSDIRKLQIMTRQKKESSEALIKNDRSSEEEEELVK